MRRVYLLYHLAGSLTWQQASWIGYRCVSPNDNPVTDDWGRLKTSWLNRDYDGGFEGPDRIKWLSKLMRTNELVSVRLLLVNIIQMYLFGTRGSRLLSQNALEPCDISKTWEILETCSHDIRFLAHFLCRSKNLLSTSGPAAPLGSRSPSQLQETKCESTESWSVPTSPSDALGHLYKIYTSFSWQHLPPLSLQSQAQAMEAVAHDGVTKPPLFLYFLASCLEGDSVLLQPGPFFIDLTISSISYNLSRAFILQTSTEKDLAQHRTHEFSGWIRVRICFSYLLFDFM